MLAVCCFVKIGSRSVYLQVVSIVFSAVQRKAAVVQGGKKVIQRSSEPRRGLMTGKEK